MANLKSLGKSKGFANCSKKAPLLLIADDCPHLSEVLPSCRCRCWRCALLILTLATEAAVADDL